MTSDEAVEAARKIVAANEARVGAVSPFGRLLMVLVVAEALEAGTMATTQGGKS